MMFQMPGNMNSGLGGSLPPMGGMMNPGNQSMKQDYGHGGELDIFVELFRDIFNNITSSLF